MKIFISWSGERSLKIAELFDDWIQCVIQAAKPWISSHDIERGAMWFSEISKTLADSHFGILCLTPENKIEPWILFEAGALVKGFEANKVCTLLIELKPTDIENPLAQFNHTIASDKDSMWKLVQTINNTLSENKLQEKVLKSVFDTYWNQFSEKYKEIVKQFRPEEHIKKRTTEDILTEILTTVRSIDKRSKINDYRDIFFSKSKENYDTDKLFEFWNFSNLLQDEISSKEEKQKENDFIIQKYRKINKEK